MSSYDVIIKGIIWPKNEQQIRFAVHMLLEIPIITQTAFSTFR